MILDEAKRLVEAGDCAAAVGVLDGHPDALEAVKAFQALLMHVYWDRKDLACVIALGQAGMARALDASEQDAGGGAGELKRNASILAYNLGSFCWPGWAEPGIQIGPDEAKIGRDAARQHQRLVEEAGLEAIKQSRAYWLLGAHALTARDWQEARLSFSRSLALAERAGNRAEGLLGRGFAVLTDMLEHPEDPAGQPVLDRLKAELRELEDGEEFVGQLNTAEAVCRR